MAEADNRNQKHFVLVHGGCHGAWCWYKVKPRLEAAGYRVTVPDLAASGTNMSRVDDIQALYDYSRPLLEILGLLGSEEKVILVAHSLGGPSTALATDMFPGKISAVVFLTSFMPDTTHPPSYVVDKVLGSMPREEFLDTQFATYGPPERPLISVLLGPKYLAKTMYQLSPIEDLELAKTLVRVGPLISSNLVGTRTFTKEGYGSVTRVYILCGEDKSVPEDSQRWMIENFPVKEVMEIKDADHMPMFSKPQELCDLLLKIADKYASTSLQMKRLAYFGDKECFCLDKNANAFVCLCVCHIPENKFVKIEQSDDINPKSWKNVTIAQLAIVLNSYGEPTLRLSAFLSYPKTTTCKLSEESIFLNYRYTSLCRRILTSAWKVGREYEKMATGCNFHQIQWLSHWIYVRNMATTRVWSAETTNWRHGLLLQQNNLGRIMLSRSNIRKIPWPTAHSSRFWP